LSTHVDCYGNEKRQVEDGVEPEPP
jgi:hypothetical protein